MRCMKAIAGSLMLILRWLSYAYYTTGAYAKQKRDKKCAIKRYSKL